MYDDICGRLGNLNDAFFSITQQLGNAMAPYKEFQKNYSDRFLFTLNNNLLETYMPIVSVLKNKLLDNDIGNSIKNIFQPFEEFSMSMRAAILPENLELLTERVISIYSDKVTEKEETEIIETDSRILSEIYHTQDEKKVSHGNDAIIVLSPINDQVLKYLSENPDALYQLKPEMFEEVMTEIYRKLGYNVERTQTTRDGGKDVIIRKPSELGDFVYYVECKKYAPRRPIGVGIVRSMVGVINVDKVNGGIIATTSYFTQGAKDYILNNDLCYQIQMHDFQKIRTLLNKITV